MSIKINFDIGFIYNHPRYVNSNPTRQDQDHPRYMRTTSVVSNSQIHSAKPLKAIKDKMDIELAPREKTPTRRKTIRALKPIVMGLAATRGDAQNVCDFKEDNVRTTVRKRTSTDFFIQAKEPPRKKQKLNENNAVVAQIANINSIFTATISDDNDIFVGIIV